MGGENNSVNHRYRKIAFLRAKQTESVVFCPHQQEVLQYAMGDIHKEEEGLKGM